MTENHPIVGAARSAPCPTACAVRGFFTALAIGLLGGLVGLGGAEFRLPVLVGLFDLATLQAVIANKALSLLVVGVAIVARLHAVPLAVLLPHWPVVLNLLAGSLLGAWWAAGWAMRLPRKTLDGVLLVLLILLACTMAAEQVFGLRALPNLAQILSPWGHAALGIAAGLVIGLFAAVMGVAGGELLIPTIVLLWGLDLKLAGSLSLLVSLPTMIVGFARYRESAAFAVLRTHRALLLSMAAGSLLGALLGGLLLGVVPTDGLGLLLALILAVSAWKVFRHRRSS
ncbi:putative permease [Thiomonas arsenitoxydans]|uniref:Probable membrane transporter protein n=1 Tax=Thiomonas arsenitoxydans (strain DSM 22701 / CIP 110005 / 3As) TaxID=426114 RepID=D6CQW3_THIA3|nr:sulfite exporter TauE/SafE family protein [Thiomonas arsenitoxydans]CAZ87004.1 putative permease [Thiomonas arsenitoxydans]CQR27779.1 putative permease [Thiomonas arsenitoxydans]CQR30043.1 putative permease [Thiomonas arsenitoxydans]CQR34295.1 putative permease [Thiomonas arsenitoxydans]CQR36864.1 putative permease [Thiomonas arsenitoxydans]